MSIKLKTVTTPLKYDKVKIPLSCVRVSNMTEDEYNSLDSDKMKEFIDFEEKESLVVEFLKYEDYFYIRLNQEGKDFPVIYLYGDCI